MIYGLYVWCFVDLSIIVFQNSVRKPHQKYQFLEFSWIFDHFLDALFAFFDISNIDKKS